jgi:glycogen(starch) synthase
VKLLLVGPYPPPYGGIATTVQDLHRYLAEQDGCEVAVLNIGEGRAMPSDRYLPTRGYWDYLRKVCGFAKRRFTIHLETNGHNFKSWVSAFVCAAAGLLNGKQTVIAFGSGNLPAYLEGAGAGIRLIARAVATWSGVLICRNEPMRQALIGAGADPAKIVIVPGFLGLGASKPAQVPQAIDAFLTSKSPVIGATAGLEAEYGIPLMVSAIETLRASYPNVGLVLIGPGQDAAARIDGFESVRDHLCLTGPLPHEQVLGLMTRLTIFLRPSYFDGDSNSVREALLLGVPVVASKTDFRPQGVMTFKKGDLQDLVRVLRFALEHLDEAKARLLAFDQEDGFERVVGLYRKLTERAA